MRPPSSITKRIFLPICLVLGIQTVTSRILSIREIKLPTPELHRLPLNLGKWSSPGDLTLDGKVTAYLRPDEYILRDYTGSTDDAPISVFVAYFKSLQDNYGPHSPRVCLPGVGWLVRSSAIKPVRVSGRSDPIEVNQYVLEKSGDRILVLYWYQNDREVWAEEFWAKVRLLPDLMRYGRSDVSLVRLITPIQSAATGSDLKRCADFASVVFPALAQRLGMPE